MLRIMNLRTVTNKKGSYILESAITLPILMIAVIVMCSIILMFSVTEDANFITATELRRGAAEAIYLNTSPLIPSRIENRIREHSQISDLRLNEYAYRDNRLGQDEIILIKLRMKLKTNNPLDLASEADYDVSLATRAYVGKIRNVTNMSAAEMMDENAEGVFIFPKRGEKYHSEGCGVLHAACRATVLTQDLKNQYNSCPVCHSRKASIGSIVYYFPNDGEDYHLPGCACLERNYIQVEKCVAIERGYTACSKCGG